MVEAVSAVDGLIEVRLLTDEPASVVLREYEEQVARCTDDLFDNWPAHKVVWHYAGATSPPASLGDMPLEGFRPCHSWARGAPSHEATFSDLRMSSDPRSDFDSAGVVSVLDHVAQLSPLDLRRWNRREEVSEGRHARLDRISPPDLEWYYNTIVGDPYLLEWLFAGQIPNPSDFANRMIRSVHRVMLIRARTGGAPVGTVFCHDLDTFRGFGSVGMILDPSKRGAGWPIEGLIMYLSVLFQLLPLTKVYFQVTEDENASFARALRRHAIREGHLRSHRFRDGRWHPEGIYAVYRHQVPGLIARFSKAPDSQSDLAIAK